MASRQAGFFVRHTEKIVLAAAVAFSLLLVAVAWAGVFGSPSATEVGRDRVTPGTVESLVRAEAEKLRRQLDATEPGVPDVAIPLYSEEFAERIAAPMLPPERQTLVGNPTLPLAEGVLTPAGIEFPTYALPRPPVVTDPVVKAGTAVLADAGTVADARAREQVAALGAQLGLDPNEPGDFQYVSVTGRFPLREWAQTLDAGGDGSGNPSIPENVWRPRLGLAAVYLLRQRKDPVTGGWGPTEVVSTLPGQVAALPDRAAETQNLTQAEELVRTLLTRQEDVARVPFPPTAHVGWTPPSGRDRVFTPAERERLTRLESDIAAAELRLERLQNPDAGREERGGRRDRGNRGRAGRGGGGGPGGGGGFDGGFGGDEFGDPGFDAPPRRGGGDADDDRTQRAIDDLQALRNELTELLGEEPDAAQAPGGFGGGPPDFGGGFDEFGGGGPGGFGGSGFNPGGPVRGGGGPDAEVDEEVTVWAHDLSAEPGGTYRYKLVAAAMNPLFRYSRVSEEQQEANRDRVALAPTEEALEAAPWTPAVTLNPEADFFFLGGNFEQDRARVEVWKVYDGLWQRAEFEENAGNGIGGVETLDVRGRRQRVDLATGALLLDIDVQQVGGGPADQRLVYESPEGGIRSRTRQEDQDSPRRQLLQRELEGQQEPVRGA